MYSKSGLLLVGLMFGALLVACAAPLLPEGTAMPTPTISQTPEPSLTATLNPTEIRQATLNETATSNAVYFATNSARGTATADARPTLTPTITVTPSPTHILSLTNREPSFEELENFLGVSLKDIYSGRWGVELFQGDIDGDAITDLIVLHPPEFFVLRWTGDEYKVILHYDAGCFTRCFPNATIRLEDWTNDGIDDIVFNNLLIGGGTSYWTYDRTARVFHCSETGCALVWEKLVQSESDDYTESSMGRYAVQTTLIVQNGVPGIRSISQGFRIYSVFPGESTEFSYTALEVNQTIVSVYEWNGESFELASEETLSLPSKVDSMSVLFAKSEKGSSAGVQLVNDEEHDFFNGMNKLCKLIIEGVSTEKPFPCKDDFTIVFWQDITGDGLDDVIVQTLFGSDPSESFDCAIQQRLLAFSWDGKTATLIADASGCVTRPEDLYGVRLEDYDGDGIPEILVAPLFFGDPELIYKFDGTSFTLWSEMPQP
jgi:hypothetical protein